MEKVALKSFSDQASANSTVNSQANLSELSTQLKKDSTIVELTLNSEKASLQAASQNLSIKEAVAQSMLQYFAHLGEQNATNLYQMVLNEVEPALLKAVLKHTGGNQSKASEALGLNRGTLRKKLQQHSID